MEWKISGAVGRGAVAPLAQDLGGVTGSVSGDWPGVGPSRARALAARAAAGLAIGMAGMVAASDPGPGGFAPTVAGVVAADLAAEGDDLAPLESVSTACWNELRTKHVYIAHAAVGGDAVRGIEEILRRRPSINLEVAQARTAMDAAKGDATSAEKHEKDAKPSNQKGSDRDDPGHGGREHRAAAGEPPCAASFERASIVHGAFGPDGDPEEKIESFARFLRSADGAKVEIAMLVFCQGDIERSTDADALVERYASTMSQVVLDRPGLRIVHCTVPLKEHEHGAKATVKKLVGAGGDAVNAARGRYNDALRRRFGADEILDIAAVESTRPDGSRVTYPVGGVHWPALAADYAEDGGRLNARGRVVVGREMLLALVRPCIRAQETAPTGVATGAEGKGDTPGR